MAILGALQRLRWYRRLSIAGAEEYQALPADLQEDDVIIQWVINSRCPRRSRHVLSATPALHANGRFWKKVIAKMTKRTRSKGYVDSTSLPELLRDFGSTRIRRDRDMMVKACVGGKHCWWYVDWSLLSDHRFY